MTPKMKAGSKDPKVLAAFCHWPILLARTVDETGKNALAGCKSSCLPYHVENDAYNVSLYYVPMFHLITQFITILRLPASIPVTITVSFHPASHNSASISHPHSGTYPQYVQHEVEATGALVIVGPEKILDSLSRKVNKLSTVEDGDNNYVSGRWPGDAWELAKLFIWKLIAVKKLEGTVDEP